MSGARRATRGSVRASLRTRIGGRRPPAPLVVLLLVVAVGGLAWAIVTPPLEGPDEDSHFAYVQRLVESRELPQKVTPGAPGYSSEIYSAQDWGLFLQLPLNPSVRPSFTESERKAYADAIAAKENPRSDAGGFQAAANNPPLYYLYEAVPYALGYPGDMFTRLQLMRLAGIPLLLIIVTMTWLLCAELLPRPVWARALAAGVVAVHPVLTFMGGVVNPDIGLAAIWSTFLFVAARMVKRGPTLRRALALGALCAASALLQPRGATLGLPGAVTLVLALLRHRPPRAVALRTAAATLGLPLAGILLYIFVVIVYGGSATSGQLSGTVAAGFNPGQFISYVWQFYFPKLEFMQPMLGPPRGFRYVYVESFFGVFGSLDVFFPLWVYDNLHRLALYGLVALIVCCIMRGEELRRRWAEGVALAVTAATLIATMHYGAYRGLLGNGAVDPILVGRYLLPLLPLFGLAVAFVCTTLPGRWGRHLGTSLLTVGILLEVWGLGLGVQRWYA